MQFISEPLCVVCGFPFDYSLGQGALCAHCIAERPAYAKARAVLRYDAFSRALVLALKYHDQHHLSPHYAGWMAQAGGELLQESDIIVPVPLHRWRFLRRRYNQAALLAQALSVISGIPCIPDALIRVRATAAQTGLTRKERLNNLKGAFAINVDHVLTDKRVLLVDDVMTTGTTLAQCAQILLSAGVSDVQVLTLARRV